MASEPCLSSAEVAFAHYPLMWFVGALDTVFGLYVARKLFDYFEKATRHIPTNCRPEKHNIPDIESMGWHRFVAVVGG